MAVGFNKSAMVRWLLAKKADIHFSDAAGNNLMHYAAGKQHYVTHALYALMYPVKKYDGSGEMMHSQRHMASLGVTPFVA